MDSIKNIVKTVFTDITKNETYRDSKFERLWDTILTEKEKKHCRVEGIKEECISVIVDSPAWLFQFKNRKATFLENLREQLPDIKDMRFKIGKVQ